MNAYLRLFTEPLIANNPITLQILGICSALAVTTSLATALTMSAALTVVLVLASGIISAMRRHIPTSVRLIIQITIIASLVIVIDELLQAYAWGMSQRLSIFVSLIVTNCIVLGRIEGFAMRNTVPASMLDALGNGLGYSLILIVVGTIRELLGTGNLLGMPVLPVAEEGGWFIPLGLMQLAPSAFFIIGLLIWGIRSVWAAQQEAREFPLVTEDQRERP